MTHSTWGQPGPGGPRPPQHQDVELPLHLRGPFLREFVPQTSYKHHGAQIASVVFYRNGGHSVITVRGRENVGKPFFGGPTSVCHIARGRHQVSFGMELPTLGDQADFLCAVDVNWEVRDFHLVAEKRVVDVEKMLRPPLLARLRMITRRHRLDGAQAADEAIQAELAGGHWDGFGAELGLVTEIFVRIDLGRAARDHNLAITKVHHDATVQSAMDRAAVSRVQANLPAARQLIEAGEAQHYAHLLAQDPSRAADVLGALQVQAKEQRQGALEYLTRLIDQGVVQRHQVEGQVQMLIDYARTVGTGVFAGGLPQPATGLATPPDTGRPSPEHQPAPPAWETPPMPPMPPAAPPRPAQEPADADAAGGASVTDLPPLDLDALAGAKNGEAVRGPDRREGQALDGQGG